MSNVSFRNTGDDTVIVHFGPNNRYARVFDNFEAMNAADIENWSQWLDANEIDRSVLERGYRVESNAHGVLMEGRELSQDEVAAASNIPKFTFNLFNECDADHLYIMDRLSNLIESEHSLLPLPLASGGGIQVYSEPKNVEELSSLEYEPSSVEECMTDQPNWKNLFRNPFG